MPHNRDSEVTVHPARRFDRPSRTVVEASAYASVQTLRRAHCCAAVLVGADILAFVTSTFTAYATDIASQPSPYVRAVENLQVLGPAWHGWGTLLVLVGLIWYLGSRGHYTSRVPFWTQAGDVVIAVAVALACDTFLIIAIYNRPVELEGLLRWVLFSPCLLVLRGVARQFLGAAQCWTLRTLLIAGPGQIAPARAALASDPALGYSVVGNISPTFAANLSVSELLNVLKTHEADFVVVAIDGNDPEIERTVLAKLHRTGVSMALAPTLTALPVIGLRQHYFMGHDIVMLVSEANLARPFSRALKGLFDQIAAFLLIVLLAPVLLTLAMLVRRDGGPALFRHQRIGAGGRVFNCVKFRTMVVGADRVLQEAIARDPRVAAEWAATQKLRNDPRVTPIGQFLRKSSLDELPQLFNVLRREMSLVGPRPIVEAEVARYGAEIDHYYAAKPGLTGLWQVSGRSDTSYTRRVRLDVWYVLNWTLWHDIAILFKTLPAVFLGRGAH